MTATRVFPAAALFLKVVAALCLLLAAAAPRFWPGQELPTLIHLLDVSDSMPTAAVTARWQQLLREQQELRSTNNRSIAFAANSSLLDRQDQQSLSAAQHRLDTAGTNIEAAINAALASQPPQSPAALIVLSDGWSTAGDTQKALLAAQRTGVAVHWIALAAADTAVRIGAVNAPQSARVGQRVTLAVQLRSSQVRGVKLLAKPAGDAPVTLRDLSLTPGTSTALISFIATHSGAQSVSLQLLDAATSELLDALAPAAVVDVQGPETALYVSHGAAPLLRSLQRGGWAVTELPAKALAQISGLDPYQLIVLDDVAIDDAAQGFWRKLEQSVMLRGAGLIVLGGPRSFGAGGYRGSRLEALLPLTIEQGKDEQRAAVLFAIDKSGSMDSQTRGASRLSYARAAALATLQALPVTDRAAVMTFDVAPQMLLPFADPHSTATALQASRELAASGGTRPGPALLEAARQLAGEPAARKLLVLVTDGFLPDETLEPAVAALRQAGVELLTIGIGEDAQLGRLSAISASLGGAVLRVGEAAELPHIMRAAVDARRAAVRFGPFEVRAANVPPFLTAPPKGWPPVRNYAVTRLRAPANALLESSRGEPLLAMHQSGSGRVLALPAGVGAWAPQWSSWREWPGFVGAMASWAAGGIDDGRLALSITDRPGELLIQIDNTDGIDWSSAAAPTLTTIDPDGRRRALTVSLQGPGHWQATQAATASGAYTVIAEQGSARQRRVHLRSLGGERAVSGVNPQIGAWAQRGLLQLWSAEGLRSLLQQQRNRGVPSAAWLLSALLAYLLAVLADCHGVVVNAALGLRRRRWRLRRR